MEDLLRSIQELVGQIWDGIGCEASQLPGSSSPSRTSQQPAPENQHLQNPTNATTKHNLTQQQQTPHTHVPLRLSEFRCCFEASDAEEEKDTISVSASVFVYGYLPPPHTHTRPPSHPPTHLEATSAICN